MPMREDEKLRAELAHETTVLTNLGIEIMACTDYRKWRELARRIDEHTAIAQTLLERGRRLGHSADLPDPSTIDDPLWRERVTVCNELIMSLAAVERLRSTLPGCATAQQRQNLEKVLDDGEAECHRLGDRLLQIAASQSALAVAGEAPPQ